MGRQKNWTDEEKEYLAENYGKMAIPSIAGQLGRSLGAVKLMKCRLGLGAFLESGDYVSLNQVYQAIYGRPAPGYTLNLWERHGLPMTLQRVEHCQFKVIELKHFWEWAERHKGLLSFRDFEEHALGKEPAWVGIKRRHDVLTRAHNAPWTALEDAQLQIMVGRKTYPEMAEALTRTSAAIKRRIYDLCLDGRPKRTKARRWTGEETDTLIKLYESGLSHDAIGKRLGRSGGAVRARFERMVNPHYQTEYRRQQRHGNGGMTDWAPAGRHGYSEGV